jgi:hypothetical protein
VVVTISTNFQAKLHALLNSEYYGPSEDQLGIRAIAQRASIFKNAYVSACLDFFRLDGERAAIDHLISP